MGKASEYRKQQAAKPDYAAQWMRRAAEKSAAAPTGKITLDGFEFIGRRVGIGTYFKAGLLPQCLLTAFLNPTDEQVANALPDNMPPQDVKDLNDFARQIMCEAIVEPQIVTHDGELEPGQVRYSELVNLAPDLPDHVVEWVMGGCPGVPIVTAEGEVSVEALENFPDEAEQRESAPSGSNGQTVFSEAERVAGHLG